MNIQSFTGKSVRAVCKNGKIYEGMVQVYFDEDSTNQYVMAFKTGKWIVEIPEDELSKVELI